MTSFSPRPSTPSIHADAFSATVHHPFRCFGSGTGSLARTSRQALLQADTFGRVTEWSSHATAVLGWEQEEVLGKRLCDTVFRWRDNGVWNALSRLADSSPAPLSCLTTELQAYKSTGESVYLELILSSSDVGGTKRTNVFIRDLVSGRNLTSPHRFSAGCMQHVGS